MGELIELRTRIDDDLVEVVVMDAETGEKSPFVEVVHEPASGT